MKISEPRAIILYADITGFSSWSRRVKQNQVRDLLRDTYASYDRWAMGADIWIKKESDGFIAVRDLEEMNGRGVILHSLQDAHSITVDINRYLGSLPFPRPPLFRLRGVLGDTWKLIEVSGRVDYGGYQMNFGRRMLDIAKDEMFLISEGLFDALGRRGCHHFSFKRRDVGAVNLMGVEEVDQRNFYTYRFNQRNYKGATHERCEVYPVRRTKGKA